MTRYKHWLTTPRTVWITGASSGIGRELAVQLARTGHHVIASARDANALDTLAQTHPGRITPLPMDISDEQAMRDAHERLAAIARRIDLAILNAGTCEYLDGDTIDSALVTRVINTNFLGSVRSAAAALSLLTAAQGSALYVVSSQATTLPLTRAEAYGASKAALEFFFRCLQIDTLHHKIHIGVIRPGFVKTPLTDRNDFSMPWLWTAEKAAEKILRGIDRKQATIVFPRAMHFLLRLLSLLPATCWAHLAKHMRKPLPVAKETP